MLTCPAFRSLWTPLPPAFYTLVNMTYMPFPQSPSFLLAFCLGVLSMISLYAVPEDDISIVSLSVVQEDADDTFDDLDLEQIEAEYRATRARAFFSAGAAARLVNLELVRYVCLFKDNVMILHLNGRRH